MLCGVYVSHNLALNGLLTSFSQIHCRDGACVCVGVRTCVYRYNKYEYGRTCVV